MQDRTTSVIRTGPHKQYTSFLLISYNLEASHRTPNINANMIKPSLKLQEIYLAPHAPQGIVTSTAGRFLKNTGYYSPQENLNK